MYLEEEEVKSFVSELLRKRRSEMLDEPNGNDVSSLLQNRRDLLRSVDGLLEGNTWRRGSQSRYQPVFYHDRENEKDLPVATGFL